MRKLRFLAFAVISFVAALFGAFLSPSTWLHKSLAVALCGVLSANPALCTSNAITQSQEASAINPVKVETTQFSDLLAQRSRDFDDDTPKSPPRPNPNNPKTPSFPNDLGPNFPVRSPDFDSPISWNNSLNSVGVWFLAFYDSLSIESVRYGVYVNVENDGQSHRLSLCVDDCQAEISPQVSTTSNLGNINISSKYEDLASSAFVTEDRKIIAGKIQNLSNQKESFFSFRQLTQSTSQDRQKLLNKEAKKSWLYQNSGQSLISINIDDIRNKYDAFVKDINDKIGAEVRKKLAEEGKKVNKITPTDEFVQYDPNKPRQPGFSDRNEIEQSRETIQQGQSIADTSVPFLKKIFGPGGLLSLLLNSLYNPPSQANNKPNQQSKPPDQQSKLPNQQPKTPNQQPKPPSQQPKPPNQQSKPPNQRSNSCANPSAIPSRTSVQPKQGCTCIYSVVTFLPAGLSPTKQDVCARQGGFRAQCGSDLELQAQNQLTSQGTRMGVLNGTAQVEALQCSNVSARITKVDDVATLYIDGVKVLEGRYPPSPLRQGAWTAINVGKGQHTVRMVVNNTQPGESGGWFEIRVGDKTVIDTGHPYQKDRTTGIKFDQTTTITVP
jgi:hypothetical protein